MCARGEAGAGETPTTLGEGLPGKRNRRESEVAAVAASASAGLGREVGSAGAEPHPEADAGAAGGKLVGTGGRPAFKRLRRVAEVPADGGGVARATDTGGSPSSASTDPVAGASLFLKWAEPP